MPYEMALMVRLAPVVRSVGGAVVVVGAGTAGVAAVSEEVAGYSSLRWLGWQAATFRFGANVAGQGAGYHPDTTSVAMQRNRFKAGLTIILLLLTAACFIAGFSHMRQKDEEMANYGHYTVGEVTNTGYIIGPNSESIIHFTYQVGDSTYKGTEPGDLVNGHTRFLVRFSTKNPANYEGYKRVPIPYYVPAPPPEGWAKLPPELDVPTGVLD